MAPDNCEQSLLYGAGLLDHVAAREFEEHLAGCSTCASSVREAREIAAAMALASAAAPPPNLRERLLKRVAQEPLRTIVRRGEGAWTNIGFDGIDAKILHTDTGTGTVTSLIRMRAGARYPGHLHAKPEHCYVLEGDLVFEDHVLHAGDYEVASKSTAHSMVSTHGGCLVLIVNNTADELLV